MPISKEQAQEFLTNIPSLSGEETKLLKNIHGDFFSHLKGMLQAIANEEKTYNFVFSTDRMISLVWLGNSPHSTEVEKLDTHNTEYSIDPQLGIQELFKYKYIKEDGNEESYDSPLLIDQIFKTLKYSEPQQAVFREIEACAFDNPQQLLQDVQAAVQKGDLSLAKSTLHRFLSYQQPDGNGDSDSSKVIVNLQAYLKKHPPIHYTGFLAGLRNWFVKKFSNRNEKVALVVTAGVEALKALETNTPVNLPFIIPGVSKIRAKAQRSNDSNDFNDFLIQAFGQNQKALHWYERSSSSKAQKTIEKIQEIFSKQKPKN